MNFDFYQYRLNNKTPRLIKSLSFDNGRILSYKKEGNKQKNSQRIALYEDAYKYLIRGDFKKTIKSNSTFAENGGRKFLGKVCVFLSCQHDNY